MTRARVPLRGNVAVISGGAGDIGQAIARQLKRAGARVAIADLAPARAVSRLVRGLHYTEADIADPAAIASWLQSVEADLGVPDIIIPNAAVVEIAGPLRVTHESWQRTLHVNLTGAFALAQRAAQRLVAAKRPGRIVFIGSWAAHAPHPQIAAYCAAKAGLRMAMQCLALELAPHSIRVNEVAPGKVDAGLSKRIFDGKPGLRERARREVPLQSLLEADEVARGVMYLCASDNRQMTGSILLMDGGLSLVRPV